MYATHQGAGGGGGGGLVELLTPAEQQQVPGPRVGPHRHSLEQNEMTPVAGAAKPHSREGKRRGGHDRCTRIEPGQPGHRDRLARAQEGTCSNLPEATGLLQSKATYTRFRLHVPSAHGPGKQASRGSSGNSPLG